MGCSNIPPIRARISTKFLCNPTARLAIDARIVDNEGCPGKRGSLGMCKTATADTFWDLSDFHHRIVLLAVIQVNLSYNFQKTLWYPFGIYLVSNFIYRNFSLMKVLNDDFFWSTNQRTVRFWVWRIPLPVPVVKPNHHLVACHRTETGNSNGKIARSNQLS